MNGIPTFDLAAPPRVVPGLVRLRVTFGGVIHQVGWAVLAFSMAFVWVFVGNADMSFVTFRGEIRTTAGTVTQTKDTMFSEGGSKRRRGTPVYAIHYTFKDQDQQERRGVSYAVGKKQEAGKRVTVEYLADEPDQSRIQGMRRAPMPPFVAFVLLFPLVALILIVVGLVRGHKGVALLAGGLQGKGVLQSKEPTRSRVNKKPVYKLTFEFVADDGRTYQAVAKTHDTAKLEDQAEEPLLYDPVQPSRAVMMDGLPGRPRIDENGNIQAGSAAKAWLCLLLPAVTILGHGIVALILFGD